MVAGGGKLNAAFLEQGLIDEIFIDVEPVLVGEGLPFVDGSDFSIEGLNLLETKQIGSDGIQLHYAVRKADG